LVLPKRGKKIQNLDGKCSDIATWLEPGVQTALKPYY
jgi:hypothetical protein